MNLSIRLMRRIRSNDHTCFLLFLVLMFSGCGGNPDGLQEVTGTVRFEDGQPVVGEMASVVFQPDMSLPDPPKKSASGTIEPDGTFALMTTQPGDGAASGNYKVVLKVWKNYREQQAGVNKKYLDAATTLLKAEVSPDSREFEFTVER